jgi:ribonuclease PH
MTGTGGFLEIQGTSEGEPFAPDQLAEMLALAEKGVRELCEIQQQALAN